MTTAEKYLSKAELYRAACDGRRLPDAFTRSLRWHLIRDEDQVPLGDDNVRSSPKDVALRAAIHLAEEWTGIAESSRRLGHGVGGSPMANYHSGCNHQAIYCANMLLRQLAQELYRDEVPEEERIL